MKVKANSVKQEYEKQDELKRSALRAAAALLQIPEAGKFPQDYYSVGIARSCSSRLKQSKKKSAMPSDGAF